ncbi:MAG: biotin--[Clostridia bacterium]|nr:biotin--[acetyl-CoA-carboxylase] ligase [Clostridia bacterium]
MSTKDTVLAVLMEDGQALSGERLARRLGVSRNSIWKAIEQLRQEGYQIEAVTNRGYRLVASPDRVSQPEIQRYLRAGVIGARMELHERLDSTNTRAKALAATGAPHGYLVIAESQSGGRGRFGRQFFSPEHSGVYMTYVLRPDLPAQQAVTITSMAAVAVARAIEAVADVDVKIKWVNDLYIDDRKVCGILCEASMDFESGQLEYAVLGIGINVAKMEFPEELRDIATSIGNACGREISRSRLIAEISNQLEALYGQLESREFMAESRARSNVIGRDVLVLRGEERFVARALDIDDQGRLVIRTESGVSRVGSGEISIKFRKE